MRLKNEEIGNNIIIQSNGKNNAAQINYQLTLIWEDTYVY